MKAILVHGDRSLRWDEVPDPVLGEDDCLIQVEAAALNRADLMQREGDYPPPPGSPEWMGLEISGTVIGMSPGARRKSKFQIGDQVCALLGGGGYAQYAAVRCDMLMPVPQNCSMIEAAAMPEAFATAYLNLFLEGGLQPGGTLLMHAGASGLASVVIPMAKAFGARVITTVLTGGIARSIEHLQEELADGHGVDVAIDCLGGETMGKCLPYLARGARWIMIAALAGAKTEIDLKNLYVRNVRIIGSTLRSKSPEAKAGILAELVQNVWPKVSAGAVRPTIYRVLPITEAEAAQEILSRGENVGKVVLTVGGGSRGRFPAVP